MTQLMEVVAILLQHKISVIILLVSLRIFWLAVYRLYLHPLAKFPGPKLAAVTTLYEFYYDGLKRGQYTFEIGRMHEKYGPIVRISPHELHVNDPQFIDTLYAGGGKRRDKYSYFTAQFGIPESVFATNPHDLHRLRRNALNRYFSKASISKLEPIIHEVVQKLCSRIQQHAGTENAVTVSGAFSCMTTDIVTQYAFARSYNFLETDSPGFEKNMHEAIVAGSEIGLFTKQFPWALTILQAIPPSLLGMLNPTMSVYLQFQSDMKAQINEVKQSMGRKNDSSGKTIFHELLSGDLPDDEKTVARLWQEGQIIVGAGTETTAWTLSAIMYYVLSQPTTFARLYKELESAIRDPTQLPSLTTLEQLPYLIIIAEGLRLSYGVSTRSQRISPHEPLFFKSNSVSSETDSEKTTVIEYEIPAGTPVGMTSVLIHHNPDLFPEPNTFAPERWLDNKGQRCRDLDGYILAFSKGSRQCVGINLAYAEMFMALAGIVRTFGDRMELYETGIKDVEMKHDVFVPLPETGSKGIRVLVRS